MTPMTTDSITTQGLGLARAAEPAESKRGAGWVVVGLIVAAMTIGWGAYNLIALLAHAEQTEHRTIPAAGVSSLRISTNEGGIRVTAGPAGSDIVVEARMSEGLHAPSSTVTANGDEVTLRAHCSAWSQYWCSVSYVVQVPADLDLTLTTENGAVNVDGVSGKLTVRTDNGTVRGTHLSAAVVDSRADIGTTSLQFDKAPEQVSARTDVGSITVVVPDDDTVYNVSTTNDIGSKSNGVRHDPTSRRTISARADVGDVNVRYPD